MKIASAFILVSLVACTPVEFTLRPSEFPTLNELYNLPNDPNHYLIDHGKFVFGDTCKMGNINWTVGVNNSSKLIYYETADSNFSTPEGLSIGSTLNDVIKKGGTIPSLEYGSVYKSKLPSGWYVGFVFGRGIPGEIIPNSEHPSWFCKQIESTK